MREKTKDKGRLQDILEYSCNVEKLIKGYSFDDFVNDIRTYYAVMKNVEIGIQQTHLQIILGIINRKC